MKLLQSIRVFRNGRLHTGRPRVWVPLASLLAFCPAIAEAQQQSAKDGEFSVQRFDPAPGPRNYFSTRGLRTEGHLAWSAGLVMDYANDPFVVVSCAGLTNCSSPSGVPGRGQDVHVVQHLFTGSALGSLTLIDRLQLGLKVPVSYSSGDGLTEDGRPDADHPIRAFGMGDMMLEAKYRAYGEDKDPFAVGGGILVTAPLGHATASGAYIGDSTPTAGLRAIFDGKQGPFSVGGNLAAVFRGTSRVGSTELGTEFRYGVGAGFEASPVIRIIVDGFGNTKFSSKAGTNSLEIDGGLQVTPLASPITIMAGGGPGVIEGVGVPKFRAILGFMYVAEARDRDGDGIKDNDDQCPTEAEDKDGYEDSDGCPDKDNDGDTIQDKDDKCPLQAEDSDGFQDTDGCPDPDNDGDGVEDTRDQCPDKKETINGFKDDDGCPDEPDKDGDGVSDAKDQCPDQPEDTDGFQDTDGCPDPDNDGDGINDEDDECVDEPETVNGYQDEDGCPDEPGKGATPKAPKGAKPAPGAAAAPKPAAPAAPKPAAPAAPAAPPAPKP